MGTKGEHNMQVPTWLYERAQLITGKSRPTTFLREILSQKIMEFEVPEPEPDPVRFAGLEINGEKIETEDQLVVALTKITDIVTQARTLSMQ